MILPKKTLSIRIRIKHTQRKFLQRKVQSWKHCYCDVICFCGSPLSYLQIRSASLGPWSHIIEGNNAFDSVSAIERWVWLNNSEQCFHTDRSALAKILLVVWGEIAEKDQRISFTSILVFRWSCFILNAQQINVYYLAVLWKVSYNWSNAFRAGFLPREKYNNSNSNFSGFLINLSSWEPQDYPVNILGMRGCVSCILVVSKALTPLLGV